MLKVCEKCGQVYKHNKCEFCQRRITWREMEEELNKQKLFPLRLHKVLNSLDQDDNSKVKETINRLNEQQGTGIFITGGSGSGKSILAARLTLEAMRLRYVYKLKYIWKDFIFVSIPSLFREIKKTFDNDSVETQSQIIDRLCHYDWLVLDDFGAERSNSWTYDVLFSLVSYRYDHLKTTIYTSNLSLEGLFQIFGDDRIPSRIGETCFVRRLRLCKRMPIEGMK